MKSTESFKKVIQQHLESVAANDPLFAETFKKENKNIDECVNYILDTVQKSGCNGFDDSEIFSMAVHYYDEDDIKNIKTISAKVIVNHKVDLTENDINQAKQEAINKVIAEEKERITKKAKRQKEGPKESSQSSLF